MAPLIPSFATFLERAAIRKGGESRVRSLSEVAIKSPEALASIDDSRFLSEITKSVFKAGFVWRVVDKKWPQFEEAFGGFNVLRCAMMSPDDIELLCRNENIIRNAQKINTVPANAVMVMDGAKEHGSFGAMIGHWPSEDYVNLLSLLKKQGARLGGNSAQYFLRSMGKDGFVLSRDNVLALTEAGVIEGSATSKKSLNAVQAAFNHWREETGYSLARLSRILAMSTGENILQ